MTFLPSPLSPRPYPLIVCARITVGPPLCSTAALYAAYTFCGSCPPCRNVCSFSSGDDLYQLQQPRISSENVLAHVSAGLHDQLLELAVHHLVQPLHEQSVHVLLEERIPIAFPTSP